MTTLLNKLPKSTMLLAICLIMAGCEKQTFGYDADETETSGADSFKATVTFVSVYTNDKLYINQEGRKNEITPISDVCTKLSIALFDTQNGKKVKLINQDKDDSTLGKASFMIGKGRYDLVIIAHNGDGHATVSSPSKITFKDNKLTDTFYYYSQIDISKDTKYKVRLNRAVAKIRLTITDPTPQNVHNMKFYYTGGSSTFSAVNGNGCVKSRQTEIHDVPAEAYTSASSYDMYTFQREDNNKLTVTISALEHPTATNDISRCTISNIKVFNNQISNRTCTFYEENEE